jgi:hypothetical protein
MVAVYMAEKHRIDLAKPRIAAAAHRAPDVVEDSRAVRIFENQRAVERTQLTIMAADPSDFHDVEALIRTGGGAPAQREAGEDCK